MNTPFPLLQCSFLACRERNLRGTSAWSGKADLCASLSCGLTVPRSRGVYRLKHPLRGHVCPQERRSSDLDCIGLYASVSLSHSGRLRSNSESPASFKVFQCPATATAPNHRRSRCYQWARSLGLTYNDHFQRKEVRSMATHGGDPWSVKTER